MIRHYADKVAAVVASAPPLTDAQRDRIAAIMRGGTVTEFRPDPDVVERELRRRELVEKAKRIARDVQACACCGRPIWLHDHVGHDWEPDESTIEKYEGIGE